MFTLITLLQKCIIAYKKEYFKNVKFTVRSIIYTYAPFNDRMSTTNQEHLFLIKT